MKSKVFALAAGLTLAGGLGLAAGTAQASTAGTPLPAYPATTTLDLGSANCVTDDVIMDDPLDSVSPVTDTYGSAGGVTSQATPPVTYYLWYLTSGNTWTLSPPPGTQINKTTGVISADGPGAPAISGDTGNPSSVPGTVTYTVRDHGKDAVGAVGTEQFQLRVNITATSTAVSFEGNTFNNAGGALTIQLNGGSTTSTALTLSAIASSLNIPEVGGVGSTPVTFALVNTTSGWHLSGGPSTAVLTGTDAADPEFTATTADHDVVFFTLSGISTTSAGVFYVNSDASPCVTGTPAVTTPTPTPAPITTASSLGDEVNSFGNGFDVLSQHYGVNAVIAGWPATQGDPATHFVRAAEGSGWRFEAVLPGGSYSGLCVSDPAGGYPGDPGGPDGLVLRGCNAGLYQQFKVAGGDLVSAATGGFVDPDGTGGQLSTGTSPVSWGGSHYAWVPFASLP